MINLVFVLKLRHYTGADLVEISRRVKTRAPDISVKVLSHRPGPVRWLRAFPLRLNPTLFIDMIPFARSPLKVRHGHYLKHWMHCDKLSELRLLEQAGLPIPRWVVLEPGISLDPADWGEYVVVKPSRGGRGANLQVKKTRRVRYKPPEKFPEEHRGRTSPLIAQQFIYTGRWPTSYRILSFMGRALMAVQMYGRRGQMPPLNGPEDFRTTGGHSIVASAKGCAMTCISDPDILSLAKHAHAVFPDVPTLGVDVVREEGTGKLYILEVNPVGASWSLSSNAGRNLSEQFGLDIYGQFNALDTAADAAIEAARRLAV
jgi:hypothetical protein